LVETPSPASMGDAFSAARASILRLAPVGANPLQLALHRAHGALQLLGDLLVGKALELLLGDHPQLGLAQGLEASLQGLVEQRRLGGCRLVNIELVEKRGRVIEAIRRGGTAAGIATDIALGLEAAI